MSTFILSLTCPDGPGIIHAVSGALLSCGANVLEQEQYSDTDTGLFFARTRFETATTDSGVIRDTLMERVGHFDPVFSLRMENDHRRAIVMVSQYDHCLVDLLYRNQMGELPLEIVAIVSNHEVCRDIAERSGIPFHFWPVTKENKTEQEAKLLELVKETSADLVVLARYMQILSDNVCRVLSGRAINIHHSFLPGFKGAKPYHQAHERGVKLIGATAHFVTSDLDEGPIIEQDVQRVSHVQTANELAEIGRDAERLALSRAVRLYAEDRIFLNKHRTVVFG